VEREQRTKKGIGGKEMQEERRKMEEKQIKKRKR